MITVDPLQKYIVKPDPEYGWAVKRREQIGAVGLTELALRSQSWRGIVWEHSVQIFNPEGTTLGNTAVLFVNPNWDDFSTDQVGSVLAQELQMTCIFLHNVPNQPLFDLSEDDLVAYTFQRYLETGEDDWPVLLPMVKSVVRAMDAVGEASQQLALPVPSRYVVTGTSKRGWTSWLVATQDARICAAIPMVYDNLDMHRQLPHQKELWGDYSERLAPYMDAGLADAIESECGRKLMDMVDPGAYTDKIKVPVLAVNATNDRYWATDAANLYWDRLSCPKWLLYVPNSGHVITDMPRLLATSIAFLRAVGTNCAVPSLQWVFEAARDAVSLHVRADAGAKEARLWTAEAAGKDLRDARWESAEMNVIACGSQGAEFTASIPRDARRTRALFGEVVFAQKDLDYTFSTQMRIVDPIESV